MWKRGFLVFVIMLTTCLNAFGEKTYRFIITDLEGMEQLQREFGAFKELLEEETGLKIEFFPVTNRTAAVEALRSKKADFVLTGPAEYVVLRRLSKCYPIVSLSRPDYYSSVIVRADSGIKTIADLKGKRVAMRSVGSTSGHLAAAQIFADNGLNPLKDVKVIHTSKEIAWESLKKGNVQAWADGSKKINRSRKKDKSVRPGEFKVIARGPDLPDDVLVAGKHIPQEIADKLTKAVTENSKQFIKAIMEGEENDKYRGMAFLPDVQDSDYNYIRQMYATIGKPKFSKLVE